MPDDRPRLIEAAFPLRQASLDSVHEKNVRHGHISTLHVWPARRPLAASRAALIATLLPDPGTPEARRRLVERIGGTVVRKTQRKKLGGRTIEVEREETREGVLHWGRESGKDLERLRDEILKAYGGRPPRVLDPFAGGGAIPFEAMRLGCEVTAVDINPVAWFILRCTLEYPQRLAGRTRSLPDFAPKDRAFMEAFFKARGDRGAGLAARLEQLGLGAASEPMLAGLEVRDERIEADLAWHVRAWGRWVLDRARTELERFYPVVDGRPTVAYLWARTVTCKNCRATVPLLKTRWLCKKDDKRVLLTMEPNVERAGVVFGVQRDVPRVGSSAALRREHDRRIGAGTMSRSGVTCPCCQGIMPMEDLRLEGRAGRLGATMTAVVIDTPDGKAYRVAADDEVQGAVQAAREVDPMAADVPLGIPGESLPTEAALGFRVPLYGFSRWRDLFTSRQLLALASFVKHARSARDAMAAAGYPAEWVEALSGYLAMMVDRLANQGSALARWNQGGENVEGTFARFALPMLWDFAEVNPLGETSGGFPSAIDWVSLAVGHFTAAASGAPLPTVTRGSATAAAATGVDVIVTDPPYYDAIPYSDLMDFFYVWLRRTLHGLSPEIDAAFEAPLAPKWDHAREDGELIDDASRFEGDRRRSKAAYEEGMFRAFQACRAALAAEGRLVIVFAHKHPDAWETLVSAIIRAGFVVDGSWPVQTERTARTRSLASAALSSSIWLVCRKRPETARPGWDRQVLDEMRAKITTRLREFWDAGIRGPDFVWAATGPALEAYSRHPVVKKADQQGAVVEVPEFLRTVRRMVVDFVVGRVLAGEGEGGVVAGLDDVTTYYLLHRHDFGFEAAPIGACILYAVSCGLSDAKLVDQYEVLSRISGKAAADEEPAGDAETESEEDEADVEEESAGSRVKLRPWQERSRKAMGYDAEWRPSPLIDQAHRLMHLWRAGEVGKVDEYVDAGGLRRNRVFHQLLQALIELAGHGSEERSMLERISNHLGARGAVTGRGQAVLPGLGADVGGGSRP